MICPSKITRFTGLRLSAYAAVVIAMATSGVACWACNVPVFRYALERWRPDPYRLTVFHRGPLPADVNKLVESWEQSLDPLAANLRLRTVDLDDAPADADQKLFAAQTDPQLPWLVVQYPQSTALNVTVSASPLNQESMAKLTASPLRTELTRRLAAGQTAVWLLLESGDETKDDAAAANLETQIKRLAQQLKLPELTSAPEDNLLSAAPLKVSFSMLRVPRGVAAEQSLVDILLHSEEDLYEFNEPMIFPVFGRGRALLPLVGAGITADNIRSSADFLVGECSCEIKELNPGFDLLLSADWQSLLFNSATAAIEPELPAVSDGKIELVAIPGGATPAQIPATSHQATASVEPRSESSSGGVNFVAVGGMLVVVVVLFLARQV